MINSNNIKDISLDEIDGRSITERLKQTCEEYQQRVLMTIENATDHWNACGASGSLTCHNIEIHWLKTILHHFHLLYQLLTIEPPVIQLERKFFKGKLI